MYTLLDMFLTWMHSETFKNVILPLSIIVLPISVTIHRIGWGLYSKWWVLLAWMPLIAVCGVIILALMALGNLH